ncbi:MAG: PA0069 family radical SAM protein [Proteobacteria bacterium]|nr:PA0069 family radical SAM protein [Pseudomonadota bacterium]
MDATPVKPPANRPVIPLVPIKGRGTPWAIAPRFAREARAAWADGWDAPAEPAGAVATTVHEVAAKAILSGNESPDIPFDLSINPYRGCEHGCVYCFARPTHSYLDLSPGLAFETQILAKVNAAERLRAALAAPGYTPLALNLGSATDAYQPAERRLGITRQVIEVLSGCGHPFSVITKAALIERDLDLLAPAAARGQVAAYVSVTTLDGALARAMEPRAAAPQRRLQTIARLAQAGVPVGVSVSPLIPFLNEPELERVLEAAAAAGATHAFCTPIRLPWEVNPLFQQWLADHFPDRAQRVMARIRDLRGGRDNDARFGHRMKGGGLWGELIQQRFAHATRRLGLNRTRIELDASAFVPPPAPPRGGRRGGGMVAGQQSLFD